MVTWPGTRRWSTRTSLIGMVGLLRGGSGVGGAPADDAAGAGVRAGGGDVGRRTPLALREDLQQHREVHAGEDLHTPPRGREPGRGGERRGAREVGEDDDARAAVDLVD